MPRKLSSWVNGFIQYTANTGSPEIFRKWTALSLIAGALERKVWIRTSKGVLYPNMYVVIVGPAGVGKTVAAGEIPALIDVLEEHHLAPTSVMKAGLIDALRDAERRIVRPSDSPPVHTFNSLYIVANELGVLVPSYDNDFMNVLTDLYDCRFYSERRRTKELKFKIESPQLNMLAATTPAYLNTLMPEGAWDQGFISRVLLIYSGQSEAVDLFTEIPQDKVLYAALKADLKELGNLFGKISFSKEAVDAFRLWVQHKEEPRPDHPKLQFYCARRQAHLLKLCIIASVSTSNDLIVTLDNYAEALDWLLEAEASMPDIFKSMTMGGSTRVMDEVWHYAYKRWMVDKKPIPEALLVEFIAQRAPSNEVLRILENMTRAGIFITKMLPGVGAAYEPRPRTR